MGTVGGSAGYRTVCRWHEPCTSRSIRREGSTIMQGIRNNLATIVVGALVVAVVAASFVMFGPWRGAGNASRVAIVHDGEGNERRLPLDRDATIEVVTNLGSNTLVVEQGAVRMAQANCPRGDCLLQRPVSQPGEQLICLPHKLWVEVATDGAESGGNMDTNAVAWQDQRSDVDLIAR